VKLTAHIPCKINLIPFNPHPGTEFESSSRQRIEEFMNYLFDKHLNVTVRTTRGDDSMAACGQLGQPGPRTPKRLEPPQHLRDALRPS
jgi:23S rRNA (adenine2503-C2)-methyltransferase